MSNNISEENNLFSNMHSMSNQVNSSLFKIHELKLKINSEIYIRSKENEHFTLINNNKKQEKKIDKYEKEIDEKESLNNRLYQENIEYKRKLEEINISINKLTKDCLMYKEKENKTKKEEDRSRLLMYNLKSISDVL